MQITVRMLVLIVALLIIIPVITTAYYYRYVPGDFQECFASSSQNAQRIVDKFNNSKPEKKAFCAEWKTLMVDLDHCITQVATFNKFPKILLPSRSIRQTEALYNEECPNDPIIRKAPLPQIIPQQ
jgi:hypothetical protein